MNLWLVIYILGFLQVLFFLVRFTKSKFDIISPNFITAIVLLVWFYPKVPDILNNQYIDEYLLTYFLTFFFLCQTFLFLGINAKLKKQYVVNNKKITYQYWSVSSYIFFVIGSLGFYSYNQLPPEIMYMSQPSGFITILIFLSGFLSFAMSISLFTYLRYKNICLVIPIVFGLAMYLESIIIHGKRSHLFELLFMFGVAVIICLNKKISTVNILAAGLLVIILNATVSDYRNVMKTNTRDTDQLASINISDKLKSSFLNADHDIINGVLTFGVYDKNTVTLNYGTEYWDVLVRNYVPGQLLGANFKNSLYVSTNNFKVMGNVLGYEAPVGTTTFFPGGLYSNFGWLGFIMIFIYGYFLNYIHNKAKTKQIEYLVLYTFFGAQIPVVIIFGIPKFIVLIVFWYPVIMFISRLNTLHSTTNK